MSLAATFRQLGPGLLFASTAIGVSHVFQSTRAGAEYGTALIWAVVLANLAKYPFFEFGPRYALATGENLLRGYRRLGVPVVAAFFLVTLPSAFVIQAAVTGVTAALMDFVFGFALRPWILSAILLGVCTLLLVAGRYALLDRIVKVIIVLLTLATLAALFAAFGVEPARDPALMKGFRWSDAAGIAFLIALMGWMPAPIDLSAAHSLWALEKRRTDPRFDLRASLFDFRVGYVGTALMAVVFLALGARMLHGTMHAFPAGAADFAQTLIGVYETALGEWARWIVAVAALTTMLSTTLTVLDALPRTLSAAAGELLPREGGWNRVVYGRGIDPLYWILLLSMIAGSLLIIGRFSGNLRGLVDLATTLSFLTAPFFAVANFALVTGGHMPAAHRPGFGLRALSWGGALFLFGFGVFYAWHRFF